MTSTKKVIDYFDLKITFKADHKPDLENTINLYEHNYDYIKMTPKLRAQVLLLNSIDLIPFLGYLDHSQWSELDTQRLKSEIKGKLEDLLGKSLHADYRAHYQWCLAGLENFEWGRFVPEGGGDDNS
jgi:hypothetical protein